MDVYLLRHGIAAERDEMKYPNDEERPLTEEGIAKMREAAAGIAAVVDAPDVILTSPLVRTKQTADIAANGSLALPEWGARLEIGRERSPRALLGCIGVRDGDEANMENRSAV